MEKPQPSPSNSQQSLDHAAVHPSNSRHSQQPSGESSHRTIPRLGSIAEHAAQDVADTALSAPEQSEGQQQPQVSETKEACLEDSTRPTDAEILSYENELRAQQQERPLLGPKVPLKDLEADYADGSQVFVSKIKNLQTSFQWCRRTRQDGNCFYRSFWFGMLESLIVRRDFAEGRRLVKCLQGWRSKLMTAGFQELVFEDALELAIDLLNSICAPSTELTLDELEIRMCDENVTAYMIMLIRMITSAEIQLRSDHFYPFVIGMTDGCMELEDFCRRNVEAMGEESDHIQLVAVADAFEVHVRVVYLDNSGTPGQAQGLACDIHDFKPDHISSTSPVHVLYRPGHYDILYPG